MSILVEFLGKCPFHDRPESNNFLLLVKKISVDCPFLRLINARSDVGRRQGVLLTE
jgi:hypothetical protein